MILIVREIMELPASPGGLKIPVRPGRFCSFESKSHSSISEQKNVAGWNKQTKRCDAPESKITLAAILCVICGTVRTDEISLTQPYQVIFIHKFHTLSQKLRKLLKEL
jgi:hypothetical protein